MRLKNFVSKLRGFQPRFCSVPSVGILVIFLQDPFAMLDLFPWEDVIPGFRGDVNMILENDSICEQTSEHIGF